MARRARRCCEYCQSQADFATAPFSIDHIVPIAAGGASDSTNLALSCQGCNKFKYTSTTGLDPATGAVVPLFNPRRHFWADHFAWNGDYTLIVGLTPIGRASVAKMHLNRDSLLNLRRVLRSAGQHPPRS